MDFARRNANKQLTDTARQQLRTDTQIQDEVVITRTIVHLCHILQHLQNLHMLQTYKTSTNHTQSYGNTNANIRASCKHVRFGNVLYTFVLGLVIVMLAVVVMILHSSTSHHAYHTQGKYFISLALRNVVPICFMKCSADLRTCRRVRDHLPSRQWPSARAPGPS